MSTPTHLLFEQVSPRTEDDKKNQPQTYSNNASGYTFSHYDAHADGFSQTPFAVTRADSPDSNNKYYHDVTKPFEDAAKASIKQENATFWNKVAIQIKLFFYSGFFAFFSQIQWKTFTATTVVHYVTLPLAPIFESIEVISNIYQIAVSHKTDHKLWISLFVNLVKFAGIGVAVGLLLAGMIATSALFATIGGAAFVFALGLKTLFHVGMSLYHLVKSYNPTLSPFKKSDHLHESLNHFIGGVISAALTVCSAFVMLKGLLVMAVVGAAVSFAGAIVGIGLMFKDYKRKQNEKDKIAANFDENNLSQDKILAYDNFNYSLSKSSQARSCCTWRNPFKGLMSGLMAQFSTTSPADLTAQKKKDDNYGNIRQPVPIQATALPMQKKDQKNNDLIITTNPS